MAHLIRTSDCDMRLKLGPYVGFYYFCYKYIYFTYNYSERIISSERRKSSWLNHLEEGESYYADLIWSNQLAALEESLPSELLVSFI